MKKIISLIVSLITVVSCFATFACLDASAETGYDRGYNQTMAGTGKVVAEGLDISEHQQGISLQKIKDAGFDYVIIRAGVHLNAGNNREDYCFDTFYDQARKAGLDIGTYFYSQAKNEAEAVEEAKAFLSYIKGKKFEYPVYLDFESGRIWDSNKNSDTATKVCYAFMNTMRDAGYLVGLYGYASWFDDGYNGWMASKLNNEIGKKYEFWMANYFNNMQPENSRTANYKNKYGMYQYTSSKTISGWSGSLDHNVCYKDYPAIVKEFGFNGYDGSIVETEKQTQKQTQKKTQKRTEKVTATEANIASDTYYASESASDTSSGNDGGCKSSVSVAGVVLAAIAGVSGAALVLGKKRKD